MPLPLSWRSDLERSAPSAAPHLAASAVLARVEAGLHQHHASVQRGGSTIRFQAGPWRVPFNGSVLHAISSGTITVEEEVSRVRVRYEIRFTGLLGFTMVAALGVLLSGMLPRDIVLPVLLMLAFVYSLGVVLSVVRFFNFLSGVLDRAAEPQLAGGWASSDE